MATPWEKNVPHFKGGAGPYAKFIHKVSKKQLLISLHYINDIKVLRLGN